MDWSEKCASTSGQRVPRTFRRLCLHSRHAELILDLRTLSLALVVVRLERDSGGRVLTSTGEVSDESVKSSKLSSFSDWSSSSTALEVASDWGPKERAVKLLRLFANIDLVARGEDAILLGNGQV